MRKPYRQISADAHLEVSPNRWRDRVPERYRDRAPRTIRLANGGDAILSEGNSLLKLHKHNAGFSFEEWGTDRPMTYDLEPGAGSPEQRLRELDEDGVDAEILYPGVGGRGLWSNIADDNAYHAVVRAYNDFIAEEYRSANPDRLIPMGVIPERSLEKAIEETEYCAELGLKGASLNRFPAGKSTPTSEDDRFWAAAIDLDMPITIHTEFVGAPGRARVNRDERGYDLGRRISTYGVKAAPIAARLAVEGIFERFPKLQIYFAENQICWLPGFLEQADIMYKRHRFYHERLQGLKPLARLPGEYIREHCLWGFMDDPVGVQLRNHVGVTQLLWSTDFPHDPSDWPHSQDTIAHEFAGVPEDEKALMLAGNAIRFFKLGDSYEAGN
jgi:predicted TIM-barrel fold metal-dependent hydrolase